MQPLTTAPSTSTPAVAPQQQQGERDREELARKMYGMAPRRRPQPLLLSRRGSSHSRTPSPSTSDDDLRIPERGQSISSFSEDIDGGSASDSSASEDRGGPSSSSSSQCSGARSHNTIPLSSIDGGDNTSSRRPTRAKSSGSVAPSRTSSSVTSSTMSTGPAFLDHLVAVETLEHKRRHERRYFDSADWVMAFQGSVARPVPAPSSPYHNLPTCYRVHQHVTTEGSLRELALATASATADPDDQQLPAAWSRVVAHRLANESARARVYFDSADYEMSGHKIPLPWQLAYKGQDAPQPSAATASYYLNAPDKGRKYFDSADYGLFLAGVQNALPMPTSPKRAAVLEASRPNAAFATVVPEDEQEQATSRHRRGRSHKTRQRGKASSVY